MAESMTLNPMIIGLEQDRNIRTAHIGERINHLNQDLDGNENGEDRAYTGSITELSVNEKMEKPRLPPLDHLGSVHST